MQVLLLQERRCGSGLGSEVFAAPRHPQAQSNQKPRVGWVNNIPPESENGSL